MRIIDSHFHLWTIGGPGHRWPTPDWPVIYRDFGPEDLALATAGIDFTGGVLVQSQADDRDTDWLEGPAASPLIAGVVGWAALDAPEAPARVATLATRPKMRGLRPMLQNMEDTGWILRPEITPAIEAMLAHRLSFDALVRPRHLPDLERFAQRWPALPIVIDHGAKPGIAKGELDPWRDDIAALAALPNVWCKLSGLRTEQGAGDAAQTLQPYSDHLVAAFGPRLMWGSDWPVILHAGDSYAAWLAFALAHAKADPARLFFAAANEFYRLGL